MTKKRLAFLPLVLIALLVLIFYLTEWLHLFNFETLQKQYLKYKQFTQTSPVLSALYFMGVYVISVLLVLPDSTLLSLLAGFLFPLPLAVAYVCISETIGATLFFLAIKYGVNWRKKQFLKKMNLQENQTNYLLFLRWSHLLPFWLINTAAALVSVRTTTFIWTTLVGVLPLSFFLVEAGEGLAVYFQTHTHFSLADFFTTEIKISLLGLGLLALAPILYKKIRS